MQTCICQALHFHLPPSSSFRHHIQREPWRIVEKQEREVFLKM